jgi:hypothetical protein
VKAEFAEVEGKLKLSVVCCVRQLRCKVFSHASSVVWLEEILSLSLSLFLLVNMRAPFCEILPEIFKGLLGRFKIQMVGSRSIYKINSLVLPS